MDCNKTNCMECKFGGSSDGCHFDEESYNKALDDLLDRIDLMFLYKDTKGVFHSASYANLSKKSIHAVVEQLKK